MTAFGGWHWSFGAPCVCLPFHGVQWVHGKMQAFSIGPCVSTVGCQAGGHSDSAWFGRVGQGTGNDLRRPQVSEDNHNKEMVLTTYQGQQVPREQVQETRRFVSAENRRWWQDPRPEAHCRRAYTRPTLDLFDSEDQKTMHRSRGRSMARTLVSTRRILACRRQAATADACGVH